MIRAVHIIKCNQTRRMKELDAELNYAHLCWCPNSLLMYRDNQLMVTKTKDGGHSLHFSGYLAF